MSRKGKNKVTWYARTRASKDVATAECWAPTVDGLLHVRLIEYNPKRKHLQKDGKAMWRVHVTGEDDCYLELDVFDEVKARHVFDRIKHLTTKRDLLALGMTGAVSLDCFTHEFDD